MASLAFLAGATQRKPWRAALLGLGATSAALVGYCLLTDSPLEGAQYTLANTRGFFFSNAPVVLGGIFTGPLFGWFGQQWRSARDRRRARSPPRRSASSRSRAVPPEAGSTMRGRGYVVTNPIDSHFVIARRGRRRLALAATVLVGRYSAGRAARLRFPALRE